MSTQTQTSIFLANIKTRIAGTVPIGLEEDANLKMLHLSTPIGGWREWTILTYDENRLGDFLIKEKDHLRKRIDEYEKKLKMLYYMYPYLAPPCGCKTRSLVVNSKEEEEEAGVVKEEEKSEGFN